MWYALNSKSWVLRSRTLETGLLCGGRTCVPGRWNVSVRSTREWKDGQTDSEVSHFHQPTNSFEHFFFCEHTLCLTTQKKLPEFNWTGTWISMLIRAPHCYFLSWDRSIHLRPHFLYRQHTCLTLPFRLHLGFLISIFASLLLTKILYASLFLTHSATCLVHLIFISLR